MPGQITISSFGRMKTLVVGRVEMFTANWATVMRLRSSQFLLLASLAIPSPLATAQNNDDINPAAKFIARAARLPAYDVVSVRENKRDTGDSSFNTTKDGIVIEKAPFREIVEFAYNLASFDLISGIPGPVNSTRFDIQAKVVDLDGDRPAKFTDDDFQAMTISLLADRFHLSVHVVQKMMTVYELVVAIGGPNSSSINLTTHR
jgi:hypothetical protein